MSASPYFAKVPRGIDPKRLIVDAEAAGAFILNNPNGTKTLLYEPQAKQRLYHASTLPNLIMEGRRGTGKSLAIRWDCHMRALAVPGFTYLILRRTMPELRKSHLIYIKSEMESFKPIYSGSDYLKGVSEAHYGNGSVGLFGHCETEQDIEKYLSAQFALIAFDEITTFDWEMVTRISSSCRVEANSGLIAAVRGGTNPLGVSAEEVYRYYISKEVDPLEDPEYNPNEWDHIHLLREDNVHLDHDQYDKRFVGLSEAYRKAWVDGEWGVEGAYFSLADHHTIRKQPVVRVRARDTMYSAHDVERPMLDYSWLHIYRSFDWGFSPDPAYCVWVAVLPDGREVPFKEKLWFRTAAPDVARDIVRESDGMQVVTTFADPTMWSGEQEMGHCLADELENNGVPLTKAKNDRTAVGYAIQGHLGLLLPDGLPKLQILERAKDDPSEVEGCPYLLRSLRAMRIDRKRPGRIADHKHDHPTITLGYFCMGGVNASLVPEQTFVKPWMVQKSTRRILGSQQIRTRRG